MTRKLGVRLCWGVVFIIVVNKHALVTVSANKHKDNNAEDQHNRHQGDENEKNRGSIVGLALHFDVELITFSRTVVEKLIGRIIGDEVVHSGGGLCELNQIDGHPFLVKNVDITGFNRAFEHGYAT